MFVDGIAFLNYYCHHIYVDPVFFCRCDVFLFSFLFFISLLFHSSIFSLSLSSSSSPSFFLLLLLLLLFVIFFYHNVSPILLCVFCFCCYCFHYHHQLFDMFCKIVDFVLVYLDGTSVTRSLSSLVT